MTGLLWKNKKKMDLGDESFDLSVTKELTEDEINRYSSSFISDWGNPKVKDLFELSNAKNHGESTNLVAEIHQRKTHENAEQGFHLSAFVAADIVHSYLSQYNPEVFNDFVLVKFTTTCKRPVRTFRPSLDLLRNRLQNGNLTVEFSVENKSFFGELKFKRKLRTKLISKILIDQPQDTSFSINTIHLNRDKLQSSIKFICFNRIQTGFGLGPGLVIAIASQLAIIQLYAMSKVRVKQNSVVMISCEISMHNELKSPGTLIVQSELQNIRISKKFKGYTVVDIICDFSDGKMQAKLTYMFDPF
jgi:hypothetical protein